MSKSEDPGSARAEELSALVDGELARSEVTRVCERWRDDPDAQAAWHTYHLIGDVLRSGDLSSAPGHDRDFLAGLRQRLAQEPVVLAPAPLLETGRVAGAWTSQAIAGRFKRPLRTSIAIAAGFMVVAGVLVVTQMPGTSQAPSSPVAVANPQQTLPPAVGASAVAVYGVSQAGVVAAMDRQVADEDAAPVVLDGQLIRDARLDEYLAAHKKFGGSSAPGGPSGFLRNAIVESR